MAVVIGVLSACAIGGLSLLGLGALGKFSSHGDTAADTTIAAGALSNIFGGKSEADRARVGDAISKLGRMGEEAERAEKAARAPGALLGRELRNKLGGEIKIESLNFHRAYYTDVSCSGWRDLYFQ